MYGLSLLQVQNASKAQIDLSVSLSFIFFSLSLSYWLELASRDKPPEKGAHGSWLGFRGLG
jgi:hypothetical protein